MMVLGCGVSLNLFDPDKRSDDILRTIAFSCVTRSEIERHIRFYESCLQQNKADPYIPTYHAVIKKLKAKLDETR